MTKSAPLLLLSVATALAAQPVYAQQPGPPAGWDAFAKAFTLNVQKDSMVGASVAIMDHGRIVASLNYGLADRALNQPVTDRTIFHWGSITKQLTAIGIMQLRDRGKLSLDDPIVRYVPELRQIHDPFGSIDSVTLRMLLSHSAGFQNATWPYKSGAEWEPFEPTTWNQLVAMMPYQSVGFKPGTRYSYSNPGYIYLARVIEQVTGDPWGDYIQKNIFSPLGLTRSYFRSTPYYLAGDRSNNYAVTKDSSGHIAVVANGRDFDPGVTVPNGGWNAPLADIETFAAFLTNATAGNAELQRRYDLVLSRTSLAEMQKPVVKFSTNGPADEGMGLAFFVQKSDGHRAVGHTGSQASFTAFLFVDPATSKVAIAAFNTSPEYKRSTFAEIMQGALGLLH